MMAHENERLPHTTSRGHVLRLSLACLWIVSIGFGDSLVLSQGELPPPPSREYVQGFECGVRYGLIAQRLEPEEDDIPTLTRIAKSLQDLMAKLAGTEALVCAPEVKAQQP